MSDEVLAVQVQTEDGPGLRARLFATGETFEIPVGSGDVGGLDVDGTTVLWWEGSYEEETSSYVDQHVYAYRLPEGPRMDVAGAPGRNVGYPQLAGPWLTWVEGEPWEEAPDEYWRMPILGYLLDPQGEPVGEPNVLVPSAITSIIGDAGWTYTLSHTFLAWEQAAEVDGFIPGTYVMDLGTLETRLLGPEAWRPSLCGEHLVYQDGGLVVLDLLSKERLEIDVRGDFAVAAPTFAAYFRPVEGTAGEYEIAARGYEGHYEQVLLERAPSPPWLSAPISASATHIAFPAGERLYLFEWQPQ